MTSQQRRAVAAARLGATLRLAGDQLGVASRTSLAVRLTDDGELRALSASFLHVDQPTDVLAFPDGDAKARRRRRVGDVAISVERALTQAPDGPAELRLLAVHGLLHCLGYDHGDPREASRMTEMTRELLPGQPVSKL